MMEEIAQQWRQWDLYDDEIDAALAPLPYYMVPTEELLAFLHAQINKKLFPLRAHSCAYGHDILPA